MDEIEEQSREDSRKQQLEADGAEQQLQLRRPRLQPGAEEKLVLQFLDSMHSYLTLFDALSSTLRQVETLFLNHSQPTSLCFCFTNLKQHYQV